MLLYDESSRLPIGDPEKNPLPVSPSMKDIEQTLDCFILSASGWRMIFAADGLTDSTKEELSPTATAIAAVAAYAFSLYLKEKSEKESPLVVLGIDSRYTGPALADCFARVFVSSGISVRYPFIVAAPEIMAYVKMQKDVDGFAYISASHNPIGYNGFKFGLSDGSVLAAEEASKLIESFKHMVRDQQTVATVLQLLHAAPQAKIKTLYDETSRCKAASLKAYLAFSRIVIADSDISSDQQKIFDLLNQAALNEKLGILAELNGSARTLSIDEALLKSFGIKVKRINSKPREFAHAIIPEGESLTLCKNELERLYKNDRSFILGYVPDNDGDRGNIVYIDKESGKAHIIEAQEVFALACVAELAFLDYSDGLVAATTLRQKAKRAIVVNDPTSLRVERIAHAFGVKVFRAEVGEANVVNLARDLRKSGFVVRILGEGSNGGNITHPAAVRDPINTIFAFLKLLLLKDCGGRPGLFRLWCEKSGQGDKYKSEFGIGDILETLPRFMTTKVYEPRAVITIKTRNHGFLKASYEDVFWREWDDKKEYVKSRYGIHSFSEINYEGTNERHGFGKTYRSGKERGGFKILFKDAKGQQIAFIWMRGSGTEPVFRVLADVEGDDPEKEAWLLDWHRAMIHEADSRAENDHKEEI